MNRKNRSPKFNRAPRSSGGFALIVAMTLMAFLVMLLVGISTLVTTETQAATTQNLQNLARQYARMGLGIALKELQRTAGLDQRITATGAIYDSNASTKSIEDVEQPYWTGVWPTDFVGGELDAFGRFRLVPPFTPSGAKNSAFQAHRVFQPSSDFPKGEAVWLVSGNEDKDPALGTGADMITPISDLSGFDLVHLFNHPSNSYTLGMPAYQRVQAPKQDILLNTPAGVATAPIGKYAWVVLDEGVKARVNQPSQFEVGASLSDWESRFSKTSQTIGLDRIQADLGDENQSADFPLEEMIDTSDNDLLRALVDPDQLSLLAADAGNQETMRFMVARLGHDLTTHSLGLLTNPVEGGLKRDLSLAFEMDDADFNSDNFFAPDRNVRDSIPEAEALYTGGERPLPRLNGFRFSGGLDDFANSRVHHRPVYEFPAIRPDRYGSNAWPDEPKHYGPTFHLLRDFYRLYKPFSSSNYTGIEESATGPVVQARGFHFFNGSAEDRSQGSKEFLDNLWRFAQTNWRIAYHDQGTADGIQPQSNWRLVNRPEVAPILPVRVNFAYRLGVSRTTTPATLRSIGVPDSRLAITLEPFVALWNPYNVAIEMDALRFTYRPDSGVELVVETRLENYDPNRFYQVEEEVRYDGGIYRLYHTDPDLRRGIEPKRNGGQYNLHPDFVTQLEADQPTASAAEILRLQGKLDDINSQNEAVWVRLFDTDGDPNRNWTIAANTPFASIYDKDQQFIVVAPETADAMLRSNTLSGIPEKLVLEPGRIAVFGAVNDEPLTLRDFASNGANDAVLLTERFRVRGGAFFDQLRSILEDGHEIRDRIENLGSGGPGGNNLEVGNLNTAASPLQRQNNNDSVFLGDGELHNGARMNNVRDYSSPSGIEILQEIDNFDRYVHFNGNEAIRITMGAPGMGAQAPSAVDGELLSQLYGRNFYEWSNEDDPERDERAPTGERGRIDGKTVGNAGLSIGSEIGAFSRTGNWWRWNNSGNGTFRPIEIHRGFGLQWQHGRDFPYGPSEDALPPARFYSRADDIPRLDSSSQDRDPILDLLTHVRTNEDQLKVRVLANNNVRYVLDQQSDGVGGFDGIAPNHVEVRSVPRPPFDEPPINFISDGVRLTGFWGESLDDTGGAAGQPQIVLFDLPRNPMTSLAQFQHAHLEWTYNAPTYVVGNSEADPFIRPEFYSDRIRTNRNSRPVLILEDVSYLMNQALFDEFYFSTLAPRQDDRTESLTNVIENFVTDPEYRLPNGRMRLISSREREEILDLLDPPVIPDAFDDEPTPYEAVAAFVGIEGAFNVNSTSVEAWTALIGSVSGIDVQFEGLGASGGTERDVQGGVFRLHTPYGAAATSDSDPNRWKGYRALTEDQVRLLAERIVHEVKVRGPFTSLSDFVNRRLVESGATDEFGRDIGYTALKGTLQAAIEAERLGISVDSSTQEDSISSEFFNGSESFSNGVIDGFPVSNKWTISQRIPHREHWIGGNQGVFMDGIPGLITQADLLQALAPVLTARSDTFRIRAYGEVLNPLTGEVEASAWCEAIVQRKAKFVVEEGASGTDFPWTDQHKLVNVENLLLGRRFEIVSFKWLDETEV
ncbi:MAG: hypothetical protein ACFB20_03420 [Opitutales bacterium]